MSIYYATLEEGRNAAFDAQRRLIAALRVHRGRRSFLEGRHIAHYVHMTGERFYLSRHFPADLTHGQFVNPAAQGFAGHGNSPILFNADLTSISAIVLSLNGSWRDAEYGFRAQFIVWAKAIKGLVFVRLSSSHHSWDERFWSHDERSCTAHTRNSTEICEPVPAPTL